MSLTNWLLLALLLERMVMHLRMTVQERRFLPPLDRALNRIEHFELLDSEGSSPGDRFRTTGSLVTGIPDPPLAKPQ